MIRMLLALTAAISIYAQAELPQQPVIYLEHVVAFDGPQSQDTISMNCDEFYSGLDFYLPGDYTFMGQLLVESKITFQSCNAYWGMVSKELVKLKGKTYTKVRMNGGPDCDLQIQSPDRDPKILNLQIRSC